MRFLFTLDGRVDRKTYLVYGLALAAVKYSGDASIVALLTSQFWFPGNYLRSASALVTVPAAAAPSWLMPMLALWTLPFMWIGIALTLRRARDAGWSPWWALAFFIPFANYIVMALLCALPTSESNGGDAAPADPEHRSIPASKAGLVAGTLVGVALGLAFAGFILLIDREYIAGLFFGAPFTVGAVSGFVTTRRGVTRNVHLFLMTGLIVTLGGLLAVATGQEGLVCIAMALPILLTAAFLGSLLGKALAICESLGLAAAVPILLVPAAAGLGPVSTGKALHEVRSSVEITASPDEVWPHVIAFRAIPEPDDFVFRLGIAYPRHASISGTGVGAIRLCVFSTGAFVEPITAWEPSRRLAFDVTFSPPPLRELSPFPNVAPPHLDNYLRSKRGEFRLIPLDGGHTRLEGSTWYQIEMAPEGYWQLYADSVIRRVHRRVLEHIKNEIESEAVSLRTFRHHLPRSFRTSGSVSTNIPL
jgi:uncharacterized membrane protein YhaH (DUF805 family)